MKKHIFLIFLLLAIPALVFPVTDEGVTITKLSMEPVPFNERRDPAADSPYNAFDGDMKTAALYSDFTMEFSKPVTIDQIKIINGNASGKDFFKRDNRERDIEITLYTIAVKTDKTTEKKTKKSKPVKSGKADDKKTPAKVKEEKGKTEPDKIDKEKTDKKDKEIKKIETPEKVVRSDEYESFEVYQQDGVKFFFTASETVTEPVKESAGDTKTVKTTPAEKKADTKKTAVKKPEKKKEAKSKTAKKKESGKKTKPVKETVKKSSPKAGTSAAQKKELAPDKNIIEITDSKKDKPVSADDKKITEPEKKIIPEVQKKEMDETETRKALAAEDKTEKKKTDKTAKKTSPQVIKKTAVKKPVKKTAAKTAAKSADKNTAKKEAVKKAPAKTEPVKKESDKIEIIESKNKTEKQKLPVENKSDENKQAAKPEIKKEDNKKAAVKPAVEKKKVPEKKAAKEIKKESAKKEKDVKKQAAEIKPVENVKVKKMTGVVRIDDDKAGRVLVYASLKDSMASQNIDLKGNYAVTKMDFRTRDDEYYSGSVPDRSGITEISFMNNGKRVAVQGIDAMKKSYIERYSKNLADSLSGETFIMYENNDVALRMTFRKDGRMEFFDRYKCSKKGDPDCTSLSMPDMWRITDGKLLMRYHTLWRVWKYELDSQNDMLSDNEQHEPPRWMKIYFKSDKGFTDKYLELYRSEKGVWAE